MRDTSSPPTRARSSAITAAVPEVDAPLPSANIAAVPNTSTGMVGTIGVSTDLPVVTNMTVNGSGGHTTLHSRAVARRAARASATAKEAARQAAALLAAISGIAATAQPAAGPTAATSRDRSESCCAPLRRTPSRSSPLGRWRWSAPPWRRSLKTGMRFVPGCGQGADTLEE